MEWLKRREDELLESLRRKEDSFPTHNADVFKSLQVKQETKKN